MSETNPQLKSWTGEFGQEYTKRNNISLMDLEKLYMNNFNITRTELNSLFLNKIDFSKKFLEIGSNIGLQLMCLQNMGFKNLYGIEPQEYAIQLSKKRTKDINIIRGDIFDIPFRDEFFDVVFTSGLLIHIHPLEIKKALKEIYRCSNKYIWGMEYYAEEYTNVEYRGQKELLWKANFPKIYQDIFPDLKIIKIKLLKYLGNNNTDIMFLLKKMDN